MSTATAELTDLDVLLTPDRRVKLAGKTWRVPGDPPTGWLLSFRALSKKFDADDNADELDAIADIRDAVVDLFLLKQPGDEQVICDAVDTLGIAALVGAVNAIYARETGQVEAEPDPTPPAAAGTPNTSRTPRASRARSRSSSSSAS
jgi:hypothetical protein